LYIPFKSEIIVLILLIFTFTFAVANTVDFTVMGNKRTNYTYVLFTTAARVRTATDKTNCTYNLFLYYENIDIMWAFSIKTIITT